MAKGFYAQGIALLFKSSPDISELKKLLSEFKIVNEVEGSDSWEISGPSLVVEYRPEVNGYVSVDIVNEIWPDDMGDPQESPELFAAWSMGHFGPFTYPNGLSSAIQQSWHWEEAEATAIQHTAFVRLRISYIFGADENAPVIPEGTDPEDELFFISNLALAILEHPKALCLFNPSGEILMNKVDLFEALEFGKENSLPPLNALTNVRMFNIDEKWLMMDSVGNAQLDISDLEVPFLRDTVNPGDVASFIRNISLYLLQSQAEIKDRDTFDGPDGKVWRAKVLENGLASPPRAVIRLISEDHYESFGN